MASIATDRQVGREELDTFIAERRRAVFVTTRRDGRPQMSLVTLGLFEGDLLIASYPDRVKSLNADRNPQVSAMIMGEKFNDEWVQIDGSASVTRMPDAEQGLVDYFRCISGEHSDWDEYRVAMRRQDKVLIRVSIERWGPISKGGFPARLVESGTV